MANQPKLKKAENTPEYEHFKQVSNENAVLVNYLLSVRSVSPEAKILDIGGREGRVSLALQKPEHVTVVENDPDVMPPKPPATYIQQSIQDVEFPSESFDIILLSHVLGVLGRQGVQAETVQRAYSWLKPGGFLVLYYNTNSGYMGELLEFARENIKKLRYDYFDKDSLSSLENASIEASKVVTPISYSSFEELGKACWYLFSACDDEADSDDMETATKIFLPKLQQDLSKPVIDIEQEIVLVGKK